MANPVGRPRTKVSDLPHDWESLVCEAAQDGASDVEIRCILGIGESAWGTLLEDSEEFQRTIKKAHDLCRVWWERHGRKMTTGEAEGNATVWIFNMKNRFQWADKTQTEVTGANGDPISLLLTQVQGNSLGVSQLTADDDED